MATKATIFKSTCRSPTWIATTIRRSPDHRPPSFGNRRAHDGAVLAFARHAQELWIQQGAQPEDEPISGGRSDGAIELWMILAN